MARGVFSARRGAAGIFVFIFFGLIITASYLLEEGQSADFLKNLPIANLGSNANTKGQAAGVDAANLNTNGKGHKRPDNGHAPPKFKPTPTHVPKPVRDPFPLLTDGGDLPPIPSYNIPRPDIHHEYGLSYRPPLFIGFTRNWPMLVQCVTSYITAGWPAESIIVVENTGVQNSNRAGKLTLQNPFYLNHAALKKLGVTVLQTPVLLTFSQMQNFFLATAHERAWPHYFYSHQDVLVYSFEDGADTIVRPGDREFDFYDNDEKHDIMNPKAAGQKGYRTIYENAVREINVTLAHEERWAFRWFQYDHLTLVNRDAMDAVGGWDHLMPYYGSDCDMNARLAMDGWSMKYRRVGIINDVSTVMDNLLTLYRDKAVEPTWTDPNPPETKPEIEAGKSDKESSEVEKEIAEAHENEDQPTERRKRDNDASPESIEASLSHFRKLVKAGNDMGKYKYRNDEYRNTWQTAQRGGQDEPYYYNADGFSKGFWILAEAGREVYRQKWGHDGCDLVDGTALIIEDQWLVEPDYIKEEEKQDGKKKRWLGF